MIIIGQISDLHTHTHVYPTSSLGFSPCLDPIFRKVNVVVLRHFMIFSIFQFHPKSTSPPPPRDKQTEEDVIVFQY